MKAEITRTFFDNTINVATIEVVENKPVLKMLEPVTVYSKAQLTKDKAFKYARMQYPNVKNITVVSIETREEIRGMSADTFIANSDVVERAVSQKKKDEVTA